MKDESKIIVIFEYTYVFALKNKLTLQQPVIILSQVLEYF